MAKKTEPKKTDVKKTAKKPVEKKPAPKKTAEKKAAYDLKPVKKLTIKQFRNKVTRGRIGGVVEIELQDLIDRDNLDSIVSNCFVPEEAVAALQDLRYKVFSVNTRKNSVILMVDADASDVLDYFDNKTKANTTTADACAVPKPSSNGTQSVMEDEAYAVSTAVKLQPDSDGIFVPAKIKALDGERGCRFDALPFFRDADEQDILIVAAQAWGETESALRIAEFCEDFNPEIRDIYEYGERNGGYTVSVDGERAMAWLRRHRTTLAFRIKQEFGDTGIPGTNI